MSTDCFKSVDSLISDSTPNKAEARSPEVLNRKLDGLLDGLRQMVDTAARGGEALDSVERSVFAGLLKTGFLLIQQYIALQGDGDVGEQIETDEGKTLQRSETPKTAIVRTVFGEHEFEQYQYAPGVNKKNELLPISARMELPAQRWSYFLQEISQVFSVDQAYNQAADSLARIFGGKYSVDTIEQINEQLGIQADEFLDHLPAVAPETEAEILVASADCKGVPLIKEKPNPVAAFQSARKRPGNRRMATVTSVYSVAPHYRTAESVLEALCRDPREQDAEACSEQTQRPRPMNKHTSAHMPTTFPDGDVQVPISGIVEGMTWLSQQVHSRHREGQEVVLIMDGQDSLWSIGTMNLEDIDTVVEVLDIVHVASYVWNAADLLTDREQSRMKLTRKLLLRTLEGNVANVIRSLRRMGTTHQLTGEPLKKLQQICGYLENHKNQMQYDHYLAQGYPIASGVIEGACKHLVKDRMERSGMRWTLEGARNMLNLRAVFQSDYWPEFIAASTQTRTNSTHPHKHLLKNYQPHHLAA